MSYRMNSSEWNLAASFAAIAVLGAALSYAYLQVRGGCPADRSAIGETCPDGTLYAGMSPTGNPIFTLPADAADQMTWYQAKAYAEDLEAYGHDDWRLPNIRELSALFENKASISGLNRDLARYWSGELDIDIDLALQHANLAPGLASYSNKEAFASVRVVRGGP